LLFQPGASGLAAPPAEVTARTRGLDALSRLPFTFYPSRGPESAPEQFAAEGGGWTFSFDGRGFRLLLAGAGTPMGMALIGADSQAILDGEAELAGKRHILVGADPKRWSRNLPTFARVRAREVYPDIDLVCHGAGGKLEYDFVVAPGADPRQIVLAVEGAAFTEARVDGSLAICSGTEELIQLPPVVYQELNGERVPVAGRFVELGSGLFGFELGAYDSAVELVLDPVLLIAARLDSNLCSLGTDAAGNCYLAFGAQFVPSGGISGSMSVLKIDALKPEILYSTRIALRAAVTNGCLAVDGVQPSSARVSAVAQPDCEHQRWDLP
jgi:hypothetical protein